MFMRHLKEHVFEKTIEDKTREILASEYNDNMFNYFDARKRAINIIKQKQKLSTIVSISNNENTKEKYTYYDSFDHTFSFVENDKNIILSHPINFFMVKKILPISVEGLINKVKSYDLRKHKTEEVNNIIKDISERLYSRDFMVRRFSENGQGNYVFETSQRQKNEGTCNQYIYIKIDGNKLVDLKNKTKKTIKDASKEYRTLLMYYSIFDSNEIYMRCSCNDYTRKSGKKEFGNTNYMCNHLMWSMANLPHYLTYYFNT